MTAQAAPVEIGVIGCGYVFDHYMTTLERHPGIRIAGVADRNGPRAQDVGRYYGLHVYEDAAALLADPRITIVANFTSIESHYDVTRAALEAGKHVYSEKPFTTTMEAAQDLAALAAENGLRLSCAPSNALSATVQTLWKAVTDGAIGTPRMIYAEFDDNPVYLLQPETWVSRSGAPWPYLHEYEMGCTWEHVGYHLTWMCAIFGPVRHVTSFSKATLPDKTDQPLDPADTPDFSVACLDFESGVVGRITCSIAAPTDHRMRIIGNRGVLSADTYRDYTCPVYLEPFTNFSLKARNLRSVRGNSILQALFGVGGRRVPLTRSPAPGSTETYRPKGSPLSPRSWINRVRAAQRGQQDKCIGLAELAAALTEQRPQFPAPDFTLHLTELTLAIQGAGPEGRSQALTTRFEPLELPERTRRAGPDYSAYATPALLPRSLQNLLSRGG
ncbi:Gfo/Idh/MocA family protein [Roseobacter sinensis]|uniref:Gfo/Idh/MocA family oxidoreductase n=1 Tax=Roseobacter sinensis TaxID=2931391 RepID=A0ABT3BK92_9RHOB|nr:Gfo/Idh/MocA family oxidoreductase [Roseobacter sp. WL0113]MCV3273774.1 Gfo/Idh/MocA family oxidoreductase [Roseobacter sp. WL0113]